MDKTNVILNHKICKWLLKNFFSAYIKMSSPKERTIKLVIEKLTKLENRIRKKDRYRNRKKKEEKYRKERIKMI